MIPGFIKCFFELGFFELGFFTNFVTSGLQQLLVQILAREA